MNVYAAYIIHAIHLKGLRGFLKILVPARDLGQSVRACVWRGGGDNFLRECGKFFCLCNLSCICIFCMGTTRFSHFFNLNNIIELYKHFHVRLSNILVSI